MPAESFLQRFHELAQADEGARCRAALGVRRDLSAPRRALAEGVDGSAEVLAEDLQYALRRLVRGLQSSRQCARQGFSLALAEVLAAFPGELPAVMKLVSQYTELQVGLKASELKDRLLGRLLAYTAIYEARCFSLQCSVKASAKAKHSPNALAADLGKGLHEIYEARVYLKAPAAQLLARFCQELCAAGLAASVPEVLKLWELDRKVAQSEKEVDVHAFGLVMDLCSVYEEAEKASSASTALKSWPACVKDDKLARAEVLEKVGRSLGSTLSSALLGDELPFTVGALCRWCLRDSFPSALESRAWPVLDDALFPEKGGGQILEAQGLRALGEFAAHLSEAVSSSGASISTSSSQARAARAERLLVGLFKQMPRGLGLLLKMLSWRSANSHTAAVFAQRRLLEAISTPQRRPASGNPERGKKCGKLRGANPNGKSSQSAIEGMAPGGAREVTSLKDATRLAILGALELQKPFEAMPGNFQRQWQEALIEPLSGKGLRTRCAALLAGLRQGGVLRERGTIAQVEMLAAHSRAPDEVILAALCFIFTVGYFAPARSAGPVAAFSLRAFRSVNGLEASGEGEDLVVPALTLGVATDEARQGGIDPVCHWRNKFWAILTGFVRRPLPEMSSKLTRTGGGRSGSVEPGGDDDQADSAGERAEPAALRTTAFHGCLSDGSLLLLRLHEWWDYILEQAPETAEVPAASKKRRRSSEAGTGSGGLLRLVAEDFKQEDAELRKRCVELCRKVLNEPLEADAKLPARQQNALSGLALSLALSLLAPQEEEERKAVREQLQELLSIIEKVPIASSISGSQAKKASKAQRKRAEILAEVPRLAAELFVETSGLVKEASRAAWRELGEFTSDETITSMCAALQGTEESELHDEKKEAEDEDGEEDGDVESGDEADGEEFSGEGSLNKAAKAAGLARAAAEANASKAAGEVENGEGDADEVLLEDGQALLQQLLGEDQENEGDGHSLLAAFASSGLEGAEASSGRKLSKRQERQRQKQEELQRKFREVDLLDIFLRRSGDKKAISLHVMHELQDLLLSTAGSTKWSQPGPDKEGAAGSSKKQPKADAALRHLQTDLAQRISKALLNTLRNLCRTAALAKVSPWHSREEWAEKARGLWNSGATQRATLAGERPLAVGSLMLYFHCAAHRASAAGDKALGEAEGWSLAEEVLLDALQDWSANKRACERWCGSVFGVFASRIPPQILVGLPWIEQIRQSRKPFIQRAQVNFVADQLLLQLRIRPPAEAGSRAAACAFQQAFAELCAELLEKTTEADAPASGAEVVPVAAAQRQKLRRESLRGLKVILRFSKSKVCAESDGAADIAPKLKGSASGKRIERAVARTRDALPSKRGEVYQLCLHVLRALRPSQVVAGSSAGSAGSGSDGPLERSSRCKRQRGSPPIPSGASDEGDAGKGAEDSSAKRPRRKEKGSDDRKLGKAMH